MRRLHDDEITLLKEAIRDLTSLTANRGYEFNRNWVSSQGWVVVPVEDSGHFAEEEIENLVAALRSAGHERCFTLEGLDPADTLPRGFEVAISADDLCAFNVECGIFRFLIVSPDFSWAISCNEWFNLFAGPVALVERMVGTPFKQALDEFLAYARVVEEGTEGGLVQIARQYGA